MRGGPSHAEEKVACPLFRGPAHGPIGTLTMRYLDSGFCMGVGLPACLEWLRSWWRGVPGRGVPGTQYVIALDGQWPRAVWTPRNPVGDEALTYNDTSGKLGAGFVGLGRGEYLHADDITLQVWAPTAGGGSGGGLRDPALRADGDQGFAALVASRPGMSMSSLHRTHAYPSRLRRAVKACHPLPARGGERGQATFLARVVGSCRGEWSDGMQRLQAPWMRREK